MLPLPLSPLPWEVKGKRWGKHPISALWNGRNVSEFWSFDNILGTNCNACFVVVVVCYSRGTRRAARCSGVFIQVLRSASWEDWFQGPVVGKNSVAFCFHLYRFRFIRWVSSVLDKEVLLAKTYVYVYLPDAARSRLLQDASPALASSLVCIADFSVSSGPSPAAYKNDLMQCI